MHAHDLAAVDHDRRREPRSPVACPARLRLISGFRHGTLLDLSATGARFLTDDPPPARISGFLEWESGDAFCRVMWVAGDTCGIAFDRPLPRHLFDQTLEEDERRNGPVASVGNIPLGRKRGAL